MPSRTYSIFPMFNMEGGINTRFSLHALLQNEVADIQNMHLETRGGVEKRKGYSIFNTEDTATTFPIIGLWQHKTVSANFWVRVQNAKIEALSGGAWTAITGAETISSSQDDLIITEVFRNQSIITDGVNTPLKWDGVVANSVTKANVINGGADTMDKAYTLVKHRERIVLGDVTTTESSVQERFESALWASTAGTLDDWINAGSEDGFLELGSGDGETITNLQDVLGYLIAFKQRSLYRISNFGASTVSSRRISGSVGCSGKHAAVVVGPVVYFLDSVGRLWRYDARGENEDALQDLTIDKLGVLTTSTFVRNRLKYAWLEHDADRDEIKCFLTELGSTETNVAWVFNISTQGFTPFRHADTFNIGASGEDSSTADVIKLAGTYDGLVYHMDGTSLTDDGTTIPCYVVLRHVDAGNLAIVKGYHYVHLYTRVAASQQIVVTQFFDFEDVGREYFLNITGGGDLLNSTFKLDFSQLVGPGEKMTRQRLERYGRWTQIKIAQEADQDLKILGILLYFREGGVHLGSEGL